MVYNYIECLENTISILESAIQTSNMKFDYDLETAKTERVNMPNQPKQKYIKTYLKCLDDKIAILNSIESIGTIDLKQKLKEKKKELEIESKRLKKVKIIFIVILILLASISTILATMKAMHRRKLSYKKR
jgi:hypothetical protein